MSAPRTVNVRERGRKKRTAAAQKREKNCDRSSNLITMDRILTDLYPNSACIDGVEVDDLTEQFNQRKKVLRQKNFLPADGEGKFQGGYERKIFFFLHSHTVSDVIRLIGGNFHCQGWCCAFSFPIKRKASRYFQVFHATNFSRALTKCP